MPLVSAIVSGGLAVWTSSHTRRAAFLLLGLAAGRLDAQRFPSIRTYGSLNEIPVPHSQVEWAFESDHLDMVHGAEHWAGLSSFQRHPLHLGYDLLQSVLATEASERGLALSYTSLGLPVESAVLHYSETTRARSSDSVIATSVAIGTTPSRATRVRSWLWSSFRWVLNLQSPCAIAYLRSRALEAIRGPSMRFDGIFYDEVDPPDRPDVAGIYPVPLSGGRIVEFGDRHARDWVADGSQAQTMGGAIASIESRLRETSGGTSILLLNTAEYLGPGVERLGAVANGTLTEHLIDERGRYASDGEATLWSMMGRYADRRRLLVVTEGSVGPPQDQAFDKGNYRSAADRHSMYALTSYWMGAELPWILHSQRPRWAPLSTFWIRAQERDLGKPLGRFRRWKDDAGVPDAMGQRWVVWRRTYERAEILFRTRVTWNARDNKNYGAPTPALRLDRCGRVLSPDGTVGPRLTSIQLRLAEGVVLVPCDP